MKHRYKLIAGAAALLVVLVAGAAVAATKALSPRQERQAIINDAANQLGVEPKALSDALKQALKNRVDAAVKDGRLTKEQAARLKAGIDAGDAPLFGLGPGGRPGFRHHHGHGPPFHAKFEAAAKYLGMSQAELRQALVGGKTLAQVAKDRNKSVDGLVDALVAEAKKKLDEAVKSGRLTKAEQKEMLSGLEARITDLVNGRFTERFHRGPGRAEFRTEFRAERPPIF